MRRKTERLVVFGKGGIGKSTVCANLAVAYAQEGRSVLVVGCDPKHDTTIYLTGGKHIPTVLQNPNFAAGTAPREGLVHRGALGIDCVEAGGPEPGLGCAGRGITRMSELLKAAGVLDGARYDVILYDVLGDVVCGGFAAPLREGFAEKVVIVTSEELMALYAANNIARAVKNNAGRGNALVGLVANVRDPGEHEGMIGRFASLLGTRLILTIPRDPVVREAEYQKMTAAEFAPRSSIAARYRELAHKLVELRADPARVPTPLSDELFHELSRTRFSAESVPAPAPPRIAPEPLPPLPDPWRRFLLPLGTRPAAGAPRGFEAELLAAQVSAERFDALKRAPGFSEAVPRPRSVNLVGLPEGRGAQECARLLESAGIAVNARLLPGIEPAEAGLFMAAERHVVHPRPCLEPLYRRCLSDLGLGEVRLAAPYGLRRSKHWLQEAAALFDLGAHAGRAWAEREEALSRDWELARRETAGLRLAFVAEPAEAAGLLDGSGPSGVPLLAMVSEMGFGVDLLLFTPTGKPPKAAAGVRVRRFSRPDQLDELLSSEDFQAVYSDFPMDERVARMGKVQFGLAAFEPGPEGALRGARRLAALCRRSSAAQAR